MTQFDAHGFGEFFVGFLEFKMGVWGLGFHLASKVIFI